MAVGGIKPTIQTAINASKPKTWAKYYLEEKELKKELLANSNGVVKFLDKAKSFVGEVPNILINAAGTGLVAPIFIKYNFLSKSDDDTRTYSAWRQPVSAVLAVITQAGLVLPFNKVISNMKNKAEFNDAAYNKSVYQDVEYLEKQIKKANPKMPKEEITKLAKDKQYEQLQNLIEELYNKNTISYKGKNGVVKLEQKELASLMEKTIESMETSVDKNSADAKILEQMKKAVKENKSIKDVYNISKKMKGHETGKFVYDVSQKYISNIEASIKSSKQWTGLAVSLAILPVTCSLLNWVYPKIMDAFFPELSTKKPQMKAVVNDTFQKSKDMAKVKEEN